MLRSQPPELLSCLESQDSSNSSASPISVRPSITYSPEELDYADRYGIQSLTIIHCCYLVL